MEPDFDWRDCVLVYRSNADFLRGKTMRIRDDVWHPFAVCGHAIGYFLVTGFLVQFLLKNENFLLSCALIAGIFGGVARFRKGQTALARRSEGQLLQAEILSAKSDMAESEGTILIYRIVSDEKCGQEIKGYADMKPCAFSPGDKLVIFRAFDGSDTVL